MLWICAGEFRGNSIRAFVRYATAKANAEARLAAYRIYVTDALMYISENTAKSSGGQYLTKRYAEIIGEVKKDTRTGEEIATDIITRAGLVVKKNESI